MSASPPAVIDPRPIHTPLDRRWKRFLTWTILLLTASYTFLDYWGYSRIQHSDPSSWRRLAAGQGIAPAQYRIGVYYTAHFLAVLAHLQFRHIFAAADGFALLASLAILVYLLSQRPGFRTATPGYQWTLGLLALVLVQFYLGWTLWFQEPETMPSLLILAASALLCSGCLRVPRIMLATSLLLVALLGSTIRVDAVIAFHAGMLLACLVAPAVSVPLGKALQIAVHLAALGIAVGGEYAIAHLLFPHAVREAALFQLVANFRSLNGLIVLVCTLPPWILTVWLALRRWPTLDTWARGLIAGSLIDCALFLTVGMSEEVRIFLPFALTLLPISATVLSFWLRGESSSKPA